MASNYTYIEARWSQGLADWIGCHVNALTLIGGLTRQIVCDNLKAGVTAACRSEPGINRTVAVQIRDMRTSASAALHCPQASSIVFQIVGAAPP